MDSMDASILTALAAALPEYRNLQFRDLSITSLHSGTNKVFKIEAHKCSPVIFRKFGTCRIVNREREHSIFLRIAAAGFGPKCLGIGLDYRIEEFLTGEQVSRKELPDLVEPIAIELAKLHTLERGRGTPVFASNMLEWSALFQQSAATYMTQVSSEQRRLMSELTDALTIELPNALALLPNSENLVFSHNDVSYPNILKHESRVYLVDYEYAGLNVRASDLAYLANEATYDYFVKESPNFRLCLEDEMSKERLNTLVETYCQAAHVSESDIWSDFYKCRAACNFLGFLWAGCMYQPGTEDWFDLLRYSESRLNSYRRQLDMIP